MFTLLKYNPLFRRTPLACLMVMLLVVLLLPLISGGTLRSPRTPNADQLVLNGSILASWVVNYLVFAMLFNARHFPFRERIGELERSLPITFRHAYFQKVLSTWIAVAAPLLTACILIAAYLGFGEGARGVIPAGGRVLVSVTAGIVVLFAWSPRSFHLSTPFAGILALAAVMVMLGPHSVDFDNGLYVHLTIIVAGVAWISARIPKGMLSDATLKTPSRSTKAGEPLWARFLSPMQWVVLRGTVLRPSMMFIYPLGAIMILGVSTPDLMVGVWFSVLFVYQGTRIGLVLLNGLDSLPIKRTRLLPFIVLPSLVVVLAAYGVSSLQTPRIFVGGILSNRVQLDNVYERTFDQDYQLGMHLRVPAWLWQWSTSVEPQIITAPWGETVTPLIHPVFPSSEIGTYNPYDVSNTNTVRFATWQVSRALAKVYKLELSPEQVHERWFADYELSASLGDVPQIIGYGQIWLSKDPLRAPNRPGSAIFVGILLWFLTTLCVMRKNVPGLPLEKRRFWLRFILGFAVALPFPAFVWMTRGDTNHNDLLLAKLHTTFDSLLASSPLAWVLLNLVTVAVAYMTLRTRIQRLEVPTLPKNGWTNKEMSIF